MSAIYSAYHSYKAAFCVVSILFYLVLTRILDVGILALFLGGGEGRSRLWRGVETRAGSRSKNVQLQLQSVLFPRDCREEELGTAMVGLFTSVRP